MLFGFSFISWNHAFFSGAWYLKIVCCSSGHQWGIILSLSFIYSLMLSVKVRWLILLPRDLKTSFSFWYCMLSLGASYCRSGPDVVGWGLILYVWAWDGGHGIEGLAWGAWGGGPEVEGLRWEERSKPYNWDMSSLCDVFLQYNDVTIIRPVSLHTHHGNYGIFCVILYSPAVHRTWVLEYQVIQRLHTILFSQSKKINK